MTGAIASHLSSAISAQLSPEGKLIRADARLMQAHIHAGGEENGVLALPQLLMLARHAKRLSMRLSRPVILADRDVKISCWCDFLPNNEGVELNIRNWMESPLEAYPPGADDDGHVLANHHLGSDGYVRLDYWSRIITLEAPAQMAAAVTGQEYLYRTWTDYFDFPELTSLPQENANLWKYFHGQILRFPGDSRDWRMEVFPDLSHDRKISGYHIFLHAFSKDSKTHETRHDDRIDIARALGEHIPVTGKRAAPRTKSGHERLDKVFGAQIGPALRQPIGRIIANAESIGGRLEGPLRSDYASYANDIAVAGRHLLALVEDLADMEAIESEGFRAAREEVDLADLGRRAAGLLAVKAADHRISIDIPAEDEVVVAIGEFRRVLQIMLNLVANAINYSPDGSCIWIRTDEQKDTASITIADQGPGISDEDRERLFDKWERLGRSGDGGSGLGLYISKKLAHAMNGDLTVDSAPGKGARFTLTLPRA